MTSNDYAGAAPSPVPDTTSAVNRSADTARNIVVRRRGGPNPDPLSTAGFAELGRPVMTDSVESTMVAAAKHGVPRTWPPVQIAAARNEDRNQRKQDAIDSAPEATVCTDCHSEARDLAQTLVSPQDRLTWIFGGR